MVNMKPRRHQPCAEDIISMWRKLSADQREQVMTFDDRELLSSIQNALTELQLNHEAMIAAGLVEQSDPFKSSRLLAHAFSFTFDGKRSSEDPSLALVAATTSIMTMNDYFLEREDFFDQLKLVLPDFLSPKSTPKRTRLPRPSWKQLWEVAPSSFIALEQNLVKTAEQALWAMASDLQCITPVAEPVPSPLGGELNEDWMNEDVSDDRVSKPCSKAGKKKRKQKARKKSHGSISTACPSSGAEDLTDSLDSANQAEACSEYPAVGLLVPPPVCADIMSNGAHASVQDIKGEPNVSLDDTSCLEAGMLETCSDDSKLSDTLQLGNCMVRKVSASNKGFPAAAGQCMDIKEWSEQSESRGPQDFSQTIWKSLAGIADMTVDDSDMADLSSHTTGITDIEELSVLMVDKIYDGQDEGETLSSPEAGAKYLTDPLPLTTEFAENKPSPLFQEAAEDTSQTKLGCAAPLQANVMQTCADDLLASSNDMYESPLLQEFDVRRPLSAIGPPPGLTISDGLAREVSFSPQATSILSPDPSDAAFTAENSMQGYCDLKIRPPPGLGISDGPAHEESRSPQAPPLRSPSDAAFNAEKKMQGYCNHNLALAHVLAQALESSPEQLMQFSRDAPPGLSSVYRDLLCLQGSLAFAFEGYNDSACGA